MSLNGKQRHFLRGQGHGFAPTVHVGKEGITEALINALDTALTTHELIKVKLGPNVDSPRYEIAENMAKQTAAELVQVLGMTVLLYRRHPEEPKIVLP